MMQPTDTEPTVIGLREFVGVIRRRRRSVIAITLVTTVAALVVIAFRAPEYTSRSQVEVRPLTVDEQLQPFAADSFVNMETEAARVTQEPIAALAAPDLGLDPDYPSDLVAAVGRLHVIGADMVKAGATVIDVGMNRTDDGLFGDVDPSAMEEAAYMTPVPGGVGPMTIAMLLKNAVTAARARRDLVSRAH